MKLLIVGAGIVGLSLARRLDELCIDYVMIEKSTGWSSDGAGICLPANAVAGLERLGLKDQVVAQSHQVKQVSYVKPNGKVLSSASLLDEPLSKQPFLALPRFKLLEILRQGMDEKVRFNTQVANIEQIEQGCLVTFDNELTAHFDLVVAADGINSDIRNELFSSPELDDMGVTNWRFLIDQDDSDLEPTYYLGSDNFFMRYPMPNNQVYCYAHILDDIKGKSLTDNSFGNTLANTQSGKKALLASRFSSFDEKVQQAISSIDCDTALIQGRLKSVTSREVYIGNVVLIGDALHGCPPSLQQGVGMGLEDVHCLADLLEKETNVASILHSFKAKRLKQVSWVVDESTRVIRLASKGRFWLGRVIRNIIVRVTGPANVNGWRKLLLWDKN
ncbi:FAD-dependent monooxygenase [Shewanella sp. UCD-KL12]|uniref:FAD-dependent monooxygenase n=1 Tax=Shewanella sp. UCD-KL12 TaxID=1917163 RepID=UPI000971033C|nr:FAD-dependent monooxygenase [Shewanella sp. UCD-KL12]